MNLSLPISIAISWAWAGSLLVGPSLLQNQGIEAFLLWATANCLTLVLFGQLYKRQILTDKLLENKYIHAAMLGIQVLCLLVQLMGIYTCLCKFIPETYSYACTACIGCFFVLLMYSKGLDTSIHTDVYQGIFAVLGLIAIVLVSFFLDLPVRNIQHSSSESLLFGSWTACVLLSGITTDLQHWQRAKRNGSGYAFEIAALFFVFYIALIACMGCFVSNQITDLILLIVMLSATTSTIDSAAVALHTCVNKKIGTILGCFICIFFGLFAKIGFVQLWVNLGVFRVALAIILICTGSCLYLRGKSNGLR